jgi:tetratricopeptide (TPR) repeat protein
MIGQVFRERYRIDEQLGQGGMGIVYRGHDLLLNRTVAVKVLSNSSLGTIGKARLLSEAQSAARLNHPNIVTIYDAGEVDGLPFIVMELVPGKTLRLHADEVRTLKEVQQIIDKVCLALEHAHSAGIIHRDLKLENMIVTPSGVVKLMDFGLARSSDAPHLTEDGAVIGTFLYMAPELLMGDAPTVQSDLYALGVVFYELACAQPPFKGSDPLALISQHLHATPTPPSTCNPAITEAMETLILSLLEKQPSDRPTSAAAVRGTLELLDSGTATAGAQNVSLARVARGRLVGRERELAEAIKMFRQAKLGESGLLLISGEPGVGKSRLTRELTVEVQFANGLPLIGECYMEGGVPYSAFAQMILNSPEWPDDVSNSVLADLIRLAPGLSLRFPDVPANPAMDPNLEQQRLYESAFTFFSSLSRRFTLLLVLEDVHWADGGSLALVRSLARRFKQTNTRALILLTFRDAELSDQKGMVDLLTNWNRERMAVSIKLHRLDRDGTRQLLEALFSEAVTGDFADNIYRETEGNPFFIEELCKALIDDGQIYRENGGWQRRSTASIELPRSIRMAIEARFNRLSATSVEVLHLAAVLGRRFEFDLLQAVGVEQDEDGLIEAMEDAERAQLLFEVGRGSGTTFEFAHAMIPMILMEGLSGMRKRRLHRRAIAALEKLRPQDFKLLAHHCLQANDDAAALDYLLKSARRARETFANSEAVANYQQAVGILNDLQNEKPLTGALRETASTLYEDLGDVLHLIGQQEEAGGAYQTAMALIAPNEPIRASRLFRRFGKTREGLLLYDEAEEEYQKAEASLGIRPVDASPEALGLWNQEWLMIQLDRFYLYYWPGKVKEMMELAETLRPHLAQFGTPIQHARFLYSIVSMKLRMYRYVPNPGMLEDGIQAVNAAFAAGEQEILENSLFIYAFTLLWNGDLEKAEKVFLEVLEHANRSGDMMIKARTLTYLTVTYRKMGNLAQVQTYAALSLETATMASMIEYVSMANANMGWACLRQGDIQGAANLLEPAWGMMQKTIQSQMFSWVAVWPLVSLALLRGQTSSAVEFAKMLVAPTTQPQPGAIAKLLQSAIQAWEQGGDEDAQALLTQASDLARPLGYI